VFLGKCAFREMIHGKIVRGGMKYAELVRGETIIPGNVPIRDEIKPVQAIKILKVLKKVERVENFEKKIPNI
jgi:hypothetical protein